MKSDLFRLIAASPLLLSSLWMVGCSDASEPESAKPRATVVVDLPAADIAADMATEAVVSAPSVPAALPPSAVPEPSAEELTLAELQAVRDRLNAITLHFDEPMTAAQRRALVSEHLQLMQLHQQHVRQMLMDINCGDEHLAGCVKMLQRAQIELLHQFANVTEQIEQMH